MTCRIAWLACALLLGSGCSIKMMYNNADRIARWAASDYLHMNEAQETYFTAEVEAIHYWHRTTELPRYADFLESLPDSVDRGVNEDDVQGIFDTFYSWWEALEVRAMPMMTEMLLSLSDEQVERLPQRFRKDNADLSEDERDRSLEKVQGEWADRYSDTMSRFSGRLTKTQKDYVVAQSVRYVPQFELWADYRRRWQQDLLALLIEKRDRPELFVPEFAALIDRREDYYGEELTAVFEANEGLAKEVTAWLLGNLTDEQRERFGARLTELATTFRELASDVPGEVPSGGGCLALC